MEQLTFEQLPKAFSQFSDRLENIEKLLLQKSNPTTIPETDQLLTIQQAAELITLSVPTLYGLVSRKEIPVSKRGKRLYFSKFELTDWIKAGRKLTIAEIDKQAAQFISDKRK
jgi:excisionase family DNA binding protein